MAAGDWSAANKQNLQAIADSIFDPAGPRNYELTRPFPVLKRFLERQSAVPREIMDGEECIGIKAYWQKSGRTDVTYDGDGTTPALSLNCDLSTGWEAEADSKTYTDNVRSIDVFRVHEKDCDNEIVFAQRFARGFALSRINLLQKLNERVVNFMDANKQNNTDSDVTSINAGGGAWAVNADLATIEIPVADINTWEILPFIQDVVNNNSIYDMDLYAGRWFFKNEYDKAQYLNLNDNGKAELAAYQDYQLTTFDNRYFDSVLTGRNLFAVDPHSYIFWNRYYSTPNPFEFDYDKVQYTIADPEYMVMGPSGQLMPLMWEVVEQRRCTGRDANTQHIMTRDFELKLLGILDTAPPNVDGETGIVAFAGV